MAKGLPKWAIKEAKRRGAKNIFAYAWTLVKRKKGTKRRSKTTRKSNPKKVRKMARKRRRGKRSFTIPLGPVMGVAGSILSANRNNDIQKGNWLGFGRELVVNYTGYDVVTGGFNWPRLLQGYGPIFIGCIAHFLASKLGVNRALGRAGVPFIRI